MANSSLSIKLVDSSTVTLTLPTADWPSAQNTIQQIYKVGGFSDDAKVSHPVSAILSITITV